MKPLSRPTVNRIHTAQAPTHSQPQGQAVDGVEAGGGPADVRNHGRVGALGAAHGITTYRTYRSFVF